MRSERPAGALDLDAARGVARSASGDSSTSGAVNPCVPCAFFIGYARDDRCNRCGATWVQHYGEPSIKQKKSDA